MIWLYTEIFSPISCLKLFSGFELFQFFIFYCFCAILKVLVISSHFLCDKRSSQKVLKNCAILILKWSLLLYMKYNLDNLYIDFILFLTFTWSSFCKYFTFVFSLKFCYVLIGIFFILSLIWFDIHCDCQTCLTIKLLLQNVHNWIFTCSK